MATILPESLTISRALRQQLPPDWQRVIKQITVVHTLDGDRYLCRVQPHDADMFDCTVDELNAWVQMTLAMTPKPYEPTDEDYAGLQALRGGCGCSHPNASPPCWVCTTPITAAEAAALGIPFNP